MRSTGLQPLQREQPTWKYAWGKARWSVLDGRDRVSVRAVVQSPWPFHPHPARGNGILRRRIEPLPVWCIVSAPIIVATIIAPSSGGMRIFGGAGAMVSIGT
jgi:hypothetical protein